MANHICLPDIRLTREILEYRIASEASPAQPFFASNTFAFNIGGASIKLDGQSYSEPRLFCVASEPPMRIMEKTAGEVILVEVRSGGLFRLFGLDGVHYGGPVFEAQPGRFPPLDTIAAALEVAPTTLDGRVAALDSALIAPTKTARPYGLGETFQFVADLTKGNIRLEDAAERLGVNVRAIERDCRRRFGRTPKRILRSWRIAHAIATARSGDGPVKWAAIDPSTNYSDQSHFLREHRALGGLNPTEMHEAFRDLDTETIFHSRNDLSVSGKFDNLAIAAEYEKNSGYRAFNSKIVQELGLTDWEHA